MNTPNKLTVLRILFVPIFVWLTLSSGIPCNFLWASVVFSAASATDHLDGALARKYSQITNFGKFADPLADKILIMSAFLCFVELKMISCVPVIIILSREFVVTSLRLMAIHKKMVISANLWGKIKTLVQITFALCVLFIKHFEVAFDLFLNLGIWCVTIITLASGAVYFVENKSFLDFNKKI
ncbi:MAG: CDP-diacylglycerol--glycerol-3-phosphate 3-phosphatidyltransferase [Oscillospiraceae bacterium]|nr:CDP-diacylglycerol--glycerol-3-phosphate 3-phosphatidyltransferase [Oscillospiraceae bacterium]